MRQYFDSLVSLEEIKSDPSEFNFWVSFYDKLVIKMGWSPWIRKGRKKRKRKSR